MNLKLASLFSHILSWPQEAQTKSRPTRPRRRLMAERLETRYALAGDIDPPDLLPPDPTAIPDPPADIIPPITDPAAGGTGDPGAGDPGTGDPGTTTPPTDVNQNPIISGFSFVLDGNWMTINGIVSDDQDPTGYIVSIWGIVDSTVIVDANHQFTLRFAVSPEYNGSVFAQTHDVLGLLSNTASLTV
jgi:hypothetical protein